MLIAAYPAVGAGFVLFGTVAWGRRPSNRTGALVLVVAVARMWARIRATGPGTGERHVLTAVYGYGMALLLFFPFSARVLTPLLDFNSVTLNAVQVAGLAVLPLVFAAGVLLGGFAWTGELDELAAWLGSQDQDEVSLRDVLAAVLGDPSLDVLFSRPETGRLIDVEGRAASIDDTTGRGTVRVLGPDGRDAGVTLSYDRALFGDPPPVEQAGRVLAVALERERLRVGGVHLFTSRRSYSGPRGRALTTSSVILIGFGVRRQYSTGGVSRLDRAKVESRDRDYKRTHRSNKLLTDVNLGRGAFDPSFYLTNLWVTRTRSGQDLVSRQLAYLRLRQTLHRPDIRIHVDFNQDTHHCEHQDQHQGYDRAYTPIREP